MTHSQHRIATSCTEIHDAPCALCDGAIFTCAVCNGHTGPYSDNSLPTDCPGMPLTIAQKVRVSAGHSDFIGNVWRILVPLRSTESTYTVSR